MLQFCFTKVADFCIRRAWLTVLVAVLLGTGSVAYVARHFAIDTDINNLLSPNLPWRQRDIAFKNAFPQQATSILAIVDAPTPEFAGAAAAALAARLTPQKSLFHAVTATQSGEFFARAALLYLSQQDLTARIRCSAKLRR